MVSKDPRGKGRRFIWLAVVEILPERIRVVENLLDFATGKTQPESPHQVIMGCPPQKGAVLPRHPVEQVGRRLDHVRRPGHPGEVARGTPEMVAVRGLHDVGDQVTRGLDEPGEGGRGRHAEVGGRPVAGAHVGG